MVTLGLSPWQAWGCVWIGYTLVAPFIVLNARPGAILHVTFPVVSRMSFGIWGSLWCVFNRAAMAWWVFFFFWSRDLWLMDLVFSVWYGVQASIGGSCVKVILRAIWPSINDIRQSPRLLAFPRTHENV